MTNNRYYGRFHFDANLIHTLDKDEDLEQLKKWKEDGLVEIKMSRVAHDEASKVKKREEDFETFIKQYPNNRAVLTSKYIYTYTPKDELTDDEKEMLHEINRIISPDSNDLINDAYIIFDAYKDNAILVTRDGGSNTQPGGILGNRNRLKNLGIIIMKVHEAVEFICQKLECK